MDLERTTISECKRRIKEKIYNLLNNKYKEMLKQQEKYFNPNNYRPLLSKFFQKGNNIRHLIEDLGDLKREYEQFDSQLSYEDYIRKVLFSIETSLVGAQMDNKMAENKLMKYEKFVFEKNFNRV